MLYEKTNIDKVFPLFVRPLEDELLSSWIFRTSFEHQVKLQTFCKIFLKNVNIWNRDIDRSASETLIRLMSEKSDTEYKTAFNTTIDSYESYLFDSHNKNGNAKFILPLGIYHRKRKRYSQLFCPSCLIYDGDKPYFRKKWRLAFVLVCDKCGCQLRDRCVHCGQPIVFYRQDLGMKGELPKFNITHCFSCHEDLRDQISSQAKAIDIKNNQYLMGILDNGYDTNSMYSPLFFEVLYKFIGILLTQRKRLVKFKIELQKEIEFENLENLPIKDRRFEVLSMTQRGSILNAACWLIQDWPNRFLNIIEKSDVTMSFLTFDMQTIPYWYYQVVSNYTSKKESSFHNHGSL